MERADIRLKGIQNMLSLVQKSHLIDSVRYSLLCGWQGLINTGYKLKYVTCKRLQIYFNHVCVLVYHQHTSMLLSLHTRICTCVSLTA